MDHQFDYIFILFSVYIMAESNARLSGVKQELPFFKTEFSSLQKLKDSITLKL